MALACGHVWIKKIGLDYFYTLWKHEYVQVAIQQFVILWFRQNSGSGSHFQILVDPKIPDQRWHTPEKKILFICSQLSISTTYLSYFNWVFIQLHQNLFHYCIFKIYLLFKLLPSTMYDYSFFVRRENKLPHYFLVILNSMSKMRKAILFFLKKVIIILIKKKN